VATATRRSRSETQAATRQHLLDAAERLFAANGFHRTSVAEIARSAGYTVGAIYGNFERKEDLAVAVLERSIEQGQAALVDALAVRGDLATRLLSVIQWRKALPETDPLEILRLELWLLALRDPRLRADLNAWQRQLQASLVRLLDEQAADLGVTFNVPTELLAGAVLAAGDGTAIAHSLDPSGGQEQAYTWALASLIANAMEPRPVSADAWPDFVGTLLRAAGGTATAAPMSVRVPAASAGEGQPDPDPELRRS